MRIESPGPTSPFSPNTRLRFDVVRRILNKLGPSGSFLEVGCGQGAVATILAKHFDYIGYEPDPISYQTATERLDRLGIGRIVNGVLPKAGDRQFDFIGAFEVLEHLEDDFSALTSWVRWLRPGGHAIVSVPAHPDRFGPADVRVGHFRRYTRSALANLLEEAGLVDVRIVSYGFPLGYLLEWVRNRIAAREAEGSVQKEMRELTARSGRYLQPSEVISPIVWVGTLPFLFTQRPFAATDVGTGWIAHGRVS